MLKDLQGQQEVKEPAIDDSALSDMLIGVTRARNKAALDGLKLLFPCSRFYIYEDSAKFMIGEEGFF